MKEVYIVAATRTAIGSFNGSLSTLSATDLGGLVIKDALSKSKIKAEDVQEVFMGNVLSANLGQAPATQAAKLAGLPDVPNTTINKVCASGMKAVMLAAQAIASGMQDIIVAGGMESMSNVPYYLDKARNGYRLGHAQITDGLVKDGLWDVYNDYHMGSAAELCAKDCHITREQQDTFAIASYQKSQKAIADGAFKEEITVVEIKDKKGQTSVFDTDEEAANVKFDKIPALKPVFQKDGTVTAANASTLNDGAAALILISKERCEAMGLKPLAKVLAFADAQQSPEWFTTSPAKAIPKALSIAKIDINDVDYFEINEAFSVVALANNKLLEISEEKVNINGGAVSLGHPLGASGARIIVTLIHVLKNKNARIGVAGICNGGGGASAIVIENMIS